MRCCLRNIGSDIHASEIRSVGVRTFGTGNLALAYYYDLEGEYGFDAAGKVTYSQPAGGLALFTEINMSSQYLIYDLDIISTSETPEDTVDLYAVDLYDDYGNLIVTLDASNMNLDSGNAPIPDAEITPENPKTKSLFIYTQSILGENLSKVASVEVVAYGGDNAVDCTGLNTYYMTIEPGAAVLELVAESGRVAVMSVVFRDEADNAIKMLDGNKVLDGGNIDSLNVKRTSESVLAELTAGETFGINTKQLLGGKMSALDHFVVNVTGYDRLTVSCIDNSGMERTDSILIEGKKSIPFSAAGKIPCEAHSTVSLIGDSGYQSIESVTFYDVDDKVLFVLNEDNAALNTKKVDCTDLRRFEFDNFPLNDAEGSVSELVFDPIIVNGGSKMMITFAVPEDISSQNFAYIRVVTDTEEEKDKILIEYDFFDIYSSTASYNISEQVAEWFTTYGFKLTGHNVKITAVEIGNLPAPTNLNAEPVDGGIKLSWQGNHCEYCEYQIYADDGGNIWNTVGSTSETEYIFTELDLTKNYRFAVEARHGDFKSSIDIATTVYPLWVKAHSLLLGDDIGVNFYMDINDSVLNESKAEIRFTVNGRETAVPVSGAE